MNARISVLVICVEAIIYLLLYNFHDCTFKDKRDNDYYAMKSCCGFLYFVNNLKPKSQKKSSFTIAHQRHITPNEQNYQ